MLKVVLTFPDVAQSALFCTLLEPCLWMGFVVALSRNGSFAYTVTMLAVPGTWSFPRVFLVAAIGALANAIRHMSVVFNYKISQRLLLLRLIKEKGAFISRF